jgi:hypothetical protein
MDLHRQALALLQNPDKLSVLQYRTRSTDNQTMKKLILSGFLLTLVIGIYDKYSSDADVYAISGCCLVLDDSGSWSNSEKTLEQCKIENEEEKDDLFASSGNIWWDVSC